MQIGLGAEHVALPDVWDDLGLGLRGGRRRGNERENRGEKRQHPEPEPGINRAASVHGFFYFALTLARCEGAS